MKQSKLLKLVSIVGISVLSMGMLAGCNSGTQSTSTGEVQTVAGAEQQGEEATSDESNTIILGTNAEFEPFEYRDGMDIVGFDIEIAEKIAEKLGKELVVEDLAFDALITTLNSGKVDFVIAGMTETPERATQVDFSDSYFTSKQMIIVKADNETIQSADDLVGKTVGVQLGTTGDLFVSGTDGITVSAVKKGTQAIVDLQNGKIDAVVIDAEPAKKMTEGKSDLKVLDVPFIEEEYAVAVKKGDTELLDTINETIKELKENGEYDKLYGEFFGKTE